GLPAGLAHRMGRNRSHSRDASRRLAGGMGAGRARPASHSESTPDDEVSADALLQPRPLFWPKRRRTTSATRVGSSALARKTGHRGRVEVSFTPGDVET